MERLTRRRGALALAGLAVLLLTGCGGQLRATGVPTSTAPPPAPTSTAPPPAPITVPLTVEGGAPRLVARVRLGGADLRVMVDTGSSGLRVPAAKLPPGAVTELGPARPYAYASGIRLQGSVARGAVGIGGAGSPTMPLEVVHSIECVPEKPECGAANGHTPDAMGGRFDGILGISPQADADIGNPLWSLGAVGHAYAVHVDRAGPSSLVLGAPADGFVLERLEPSGGAATTGRRRRESADPAPVDAPPGWQARTTICVRALVVPSGSTCLPTLFDTGTPPLANIHPPGPTPASAPPGSPVTFSTPDGRWSSTDRPEPGRDATVSPATTRGTAGTITAGLPAFDHTDVRYDLAAGTVGLREH